MPFAAPYRILDLLPLPDELPELELELLPPPEPELPLDVFAVPAAACVFPLRP